MKEFYSRVSFRVRSPVSRKIIFIMYSSSSSRILLQSCACYFQTCVDEFLRYLGRSRDDLDFEGSPTTATPTCFLRETIETRRVETNRWCAFHRRVIIHGSLFSVRLSRRDKCCHGSLNGFAKLAGREYCLRTRLKPRKHACE